MRGFERVTLCHRQKAQECAVQMVGALGGSDRGGSAFIVGGSLDTARRCPATPCTPKPRQPVPAVSIAHWSAVRCVACTLCPQISNSQAHFWSEWRRSLVGRKCNPSTLVVRWWLRLAGGRCCGSVRATGSTRVRCRARACTSAEATVPTVVYTSSADSSCATLPKTARCSLPASASRFLAHL